MEQLNRKTIKTTPIFSTDWYLYKTHLHPISVKPQEQNSATATESCRTKKIRTNHGVMITVKQKTPSFEELLLEAIDEGLDVLGESSKQVVYFNLEKTFKMNRLDIPYNIEKFTDAIERIFETGAKILEIQIMKCLFKRVEYSIKNYSEPKNLTFIEYVAAVKRAKENCENTNEHPLNKNHNQNQKRQHI